MRKGYLPDHALQERNVELHQEALIIEPGVMDSVGTCP